MVKYGQDHFSSSAIHSGPLPRQIFSNILQQMVKNLIYALFRTVFAKCFTNFHSKDEKNRTMRGIRRLTSRFFFSQELEELRRKRREKGSEWMADGKKCRKDHF